MLKKWAWRLELLCRINVGKMRECNKLTANIWEGPFASWGEAEKNASQSSEGFCKHDWVERVVQQLIDYRAEIEKFGSAPPPRACNLPLISSLLFPNSIIDFGGSSGWCYDYLCNTLPSHVINSFTIVEVNEINRYMQKSGLHDEPVSYRLLEDELPKCDMIYSNSVLQYFESNAKLIEAAVKSEPEYIFLEDVVTNGSKEDFFATQLFYGERIPYRFIGLTRLIDDLEDIGYDVQFKCAYPSPVGGVIGPFPMNNFPEEFRIRFTLSLLFKKRTIRCG